MLFLRKKEKPSRWGSNIEVFSSVCRNIERLGVNPKGIINAMITWDNLSLPIDCAPRVTCTLRSSAGYPEVKDGSLYFYQTSHGGLCDGITFSHAGSSDIWGGVAWNGFIEICRFKIPTIQAYNVNSYQHIIQSHGVVGVGVDSGTVNLRYDTGGGDYQFQMYIVDTAGYSSTVNGYNAYDYNTWVNGLFTAKISARGNNLYARLNKTELTEYSQNGAGGMGDSNVGRYRSGICFGASPQYNPPQYYGFRGYIDTFVLVGNNQWLPNLSDREVFNDKLDYDPYLLFRRSSPILYFDLAATVKPVVYTKPKARVSKPTAGSTIDWSNPLTKNLQCFYVFSPQTATFDYVANRVRGISYIGTPPTFNNNHLITSSANDSYVNILLPTALPTINNFTLATANTKVGGAGVAWSLLQRSQANWFGAYGNTGGSCSYANNNVFDGAAHTTDKLVLEGCSHGITSVQAGLIESVSKDYATDTSFTLVNSSVQNLALGASVRLSIDNESSYEYVYLAFWDRALNLTEKRQFINNPWQIFNPSDILLTFNQSGPDSGNHILLNNPEDLATDLAEPIRFEWVSYPGAAGYQLQVATDPNFNNIVLDVSWIYNTYYETSDLTPNIQYYWQVRALY